MKKRITLASLAESFAGMSKTLDRVLGIVLNLRDGMTVVEGDIKTIKQDVAVLTVSMDRAIGTDKNHEAEVAALRHADKRHEARLDRLEARA